MTTLMQHLDPQIQEVVDILKTSRKQKAKIGGTKVSKSCGQAVNALTETTNIH